MSNPTERQIVNIELEEEKINKQWITYIKDLCNNIANQIKEINMDKTDKYILIFILTYSINNFVTGKHDLLVSDDLRDILLYQNALNELLDILKTPKWNELLEYIKSTFFNTMDNPYIDPYYYHIPNSYITERLNRLMLKFYKEVIEPGFKNRDNIQQELLKLDSANPIEQFESKLKTSFTKAKDKMKLLNTLKSRSINIINYYKFWLTNNPDNEQYKNYYSRGQLGLKLYYKYILTLVILPAIYLLRKKRGKGGSDIKEIVMKKESDLESESDLAIKKEKFKRLLPLIIEYMKRKRRI